MLHLLVVQGDAPLELLHPMRYWGYQWWSGAGSDLGEVTLVTTAIVGLITALRIYRKHTECHVDGCSKRGHPVHGTPYRACHEHHPASVHGSEPITAQHIADAALDDSTPAINRRRAN
jgi:hypothetical protein